MRERAGRSNCSDAPGRSQFSGGADARGWQAAGALPTRDFLAETGVARGPAAQRIVVRPKVVMSIAFPPTSRFMSCPGEAAARRAVRMQDRSRNAGARPTSGDAESTRTSSALRRSADNGATPAQHQPGHERPAAGK